MLTEAVLSALVNLAVLAGVPFFAYAAYLKARRGVGVRESARRAGLRLGERRFLAYSSAFAAGAVAMLIVWPPPLDPFLRVGSPQRAFMGLGLSGPAILLALLYGIVTTGFSEELLFRGLIGGSLARRLPIAWANLLQAVIFFSPHLLVLTVMPEMWPILPLVLVGALFVGWIRIRSGSILGPWLVHAALNVATCLSVSVRSAGALKSIPPP